jgi:hypothetical protein
MWLLMPTQKHYAWNTPAQKRGVNHMLTQPQVAPNQPVVESRLLKMQAGKDVFKKAIPNARDSAVRRGGMAAGIQAGFNYVVKRDNAWWETQHSVLNRIFNMQPFMLNGHILPPVITEGHDAFNIHGGITSALSPKKGISGYESAAASRVVFRIERPAQLVTAVPTWRDYLLINDQVSKKINPVLLPQIGNSHERAIWQAAVEKGFTYGENQANNTELNNVHRLQRAMTGMIRFLRLKQLGMVQGPILAESNPEIKVAGKQLEVGVKTFTITLPAGFSSPSEWRSLVHGR